MENKEQLRRVWDGNSETDCVEVCRELQRAGIDFSTTQRPVSRSSRMGVVWRFDVYVSSLDYPSARRVLGIEEGNEKESRDATFEIKESTAPVTELDPESQTRVEAYLNRWNPGDATVEVGARDASDESSIVELSLRENLIHYRLERLENGKRKYFVRAEDERRAREILREIERGEPSS
jgi:hypothetical protein